MQSCGKRHAYCGNCRPEIAAKVGRTGREVWNKGLTGVQEGHWKGKHLPAKMRAKISLTVSKLLLGNKRTKGTKRTSEQLLKLKGRPSWNKGRTGVYTEETLKRISESVAKAHARGDYQRGPTCLEYALQMLLENADLAFEAQVRFGRYIVDAYVKSRNLVFEADGLFWYHHQDQKREQKRDNYLVQKGVLAVVHLDDDDPNPWIPQ